MPVSVQCECTCVSVHVCVCERVCRAQQWPLLLAHNPHGGGAGGSQAGAGMAGRVQGQEGRLPPLPLRALPGEVRPKALLTPMPRTVVPASAWLPPTALANASRPISQGFAATSGRVAPGWLGSPSHSGFPFLPGVGGHACCLLCTPARPLGLSDRRQVPGASSLGAASGAGGQQPRHGGDGQGAAVHPRALLSARPAPCRPRGHPSLPPGSGSGGGRGLSAVGCRLPRPPVTWGRSSHELGVLRLGCMWGAGSEL